MMIASLGQVYGYAQIANQSCRRETLTRCDELATPSDETAKMTASGAVFYGRYGGLVTSKSVVMNYLDAYQE
jgi:hypothetical protein